MLLQLQLLVVTSSLKLSVVLKRDARAAVSPRSADYCRAGSQGAEASAQVLTSAQKICTTSFMLHVILTPLSTDA